jgi:hypothetical protein
MIQAHMTAFVESVPDHPVEVSNMASLRFIVPSLGLEGRNTRA